MIGCMFLIIVALLSMLLGLIGGIWYHFKVMQRLKNILWNAGNALKEKDDFSIGYKSAIGYAIKQIERVDADEKNV